MLPLFKSQPLIDVLGLPFTSNCSLADTDLGSGLMHRVWTLLWAASGTAAFSWATLPVLAPLPSERLGQEGMFFLLSWLSRSFWWLVPPNLSNRKGTPPSTEEGQVVQKDEHCAAG